MPIVDPAQSWIEAKLYPDGRPAAVPTRTDYPGENPRLAAFIAERLCPAEPEAAAPPRALTQAEVDGWGEPERHAWGILTAPGQQQALLDGDPEVTAHFRVLASIYDGEVIDEG